MKYPLALVVALVAVLAAASTASAADFQAYVELGVSIDQEFMQHDLPSSWEIRAWGMGGGWEFDSWQVGADFFLREIDGFGLHNLTVIRTYDLYVGYKLIDHERFELLCLAGVLCNDADVELPIPVKIGFSTTGWVVGVQAELCIGSIILEGRLLSAVNPDAELTLTLIGPHGAYLTLGHTFSEAEVLLADVRCTWRISECFGIYGAFHHIKSTVVFGGGELDVGQADWYALGATLYL